jgi:hypothetical protein
MRPVLHFAGGTGEVDHRALAAAHCVQVVPLPSGQLSSQTEPTGAKFPCPPVTT